MMDHAHTVIVGAGVVGLAVAAELSAGLREGPLVVMERHQKFGQETSSRNSEVIHAGIYYPPGSLKAGLCVEGKQLLYDFCDTWDVPYLKCGKLIVAVTDEEAAGLAQLVERGRANGVDDLVLLDSRAARAMEPAVSARAAVFSPSTGIVDSHGLMARLEWLAGRRGAIMAYGHEFVAAQPHGRKNIVSYRGPDGDTHRLECSWIVNCAGLSAHSVAAGMGIDIDRAGYRQLLCKGEYFSIPASKARRISRLVYPPPFQDLRGLGIHVTRSLDGRVRLGPNAFYVDAVDYAVDPRHAARFYESAKTFLPLLEKHDLQPDLAGIRPKLQPPGGPLHDFVVCRETGRGHETIINLVGIESPGLTACLSIARLVGDLVAL